jgi:2-methylcitrate dehydratase PrpD
VTDRQAYKTALLDWLACAVAGAREPAARAAQAAGNGLLERVAARGAAGHVLDFDDTFLPGLSHLSAVAAPAALELGAAIDATVGAVLDAYAAGFEAAGALAGAGHPALYDRGWHPTAVCGTVGAAVAGARLLGLDEDRTGAAVAIAVTRASGLRAAFGSDGKSLQVGWGAAAGVHAAQLAAGGASVPKAVVTGPRGYAGTFGAPWAEPVPAAPPAIRANWIKAYPCCLQTHGAIECAAAARASGAADGGALTVVAHPVSRQAASYDDVAEPLQGKFSIPYTTAFTLLHGPPRVADFARLDPAARALAAERIRVRTDPALLESEFLLVRDGEPVAHVTAALGSPARPMDAAALAAKVRDLAGEDLLWILDDETAPARDLLAARR